MTRAIGRLLVESSGLPIFWQFVGLGTKKDYGILAGYQSLAGRVLDNSGFFAVDDFETASDRELYGRLLGEFPKWLKAAKAKGVVD